MTNSEGKIEVGVAETASQEERRGSVVEASAVSIAQHRQFAQFRGRPMVMEREPYPHYVPLYKDRFESIAYPILGGVSRSRINDVFSYLSNVTEDLTDYDNLILFGLTDTMESFYHPQAQTAIWDMDNLSFRDDLTGADQVIWRSPYGHLPTPPVHKRLPFIMQLAGNDTGLYDDIMQSLAPLIMSRKPDGVIWWVGDGANGKSTLMDAIYKIFPGQLSSITVKRLTDGRDTPSLNGTLANVVKESSEGRIEDTEIYKSVGTHESFRVHKFHSQDDVEIRGNLHHIFSGNSVPTFNDKGYSARRRTFIIPFGQRFKSDPTFEERTFTSEMFGQLITEITRYAKRIEAQGFRYKWSAATLAAKADYDTDANNAEEYVKYLVAQGVMGFESYSPIKFDYENWCSDEGYVPLGITNLRRALHAVGFDRTSQREDGVVKNIYCLPDIKPTELQPFGMGRPGMYTVPGFQPPEEVETPEFADPVEEAEKPVEVPKSILNGKW